MKSDPEIRLGVNIDHVATIRNARGAPWPDVLRAAKTAANAGADGITAHLREDRRHIMDSDIELLMHEIDLPLNLEMAPNAQMCEIALRFRPHACCLVPEKRNELTTEGGLDVVGGFTKISGFVRMLSTAGIRVSLFVDPEIEQIAAARDCRAAVVELHTGSYCHAWLEKNPKMMESELAKLLHAATAASQAGMEIHAGHGITFTTVAAITKIPNLRELNIGHFLIAEAVFCGLPAAIKKMRRLIDLAIPQPRPRPRPRPHDAS